MIFEGLNPRQRKELVEELKRHLTINLRNDKNTLSVAINWTTHCADNTEKNEELCRSILIFDDEDEVV